MANEIFYDYVAGAISGVAGLVVGHPLDTAKVQMQTNLGSYRNVLEVVRSLNAHGWRHGFLRGLSFPLYTNTLINCVFFGVYGNTMKVIQIWRPPLSSSSSATLPPRRLDCIVAALIAGMAQLVIACPVDAVKVILQSRLEKSQGRQALGKDGLKFRGPLSCLRQLYRHGGLGNCYRGFRAMLLRDLPASAIYFVSYEEAVGRLRSAGFGDRRGLAASLVAGGCAGVASWVAVLPLDVVKSHFQTDFDGRKYRGLVHCFRSIYGAGGLLAFYAGLVPCVVRAFITNAVILTVNEECLRMLKRNK